MKTFSRELLFLLLCLGAFPAAAASGPDRELSGKLNKRYRELITRTETGKKFYERFEKARGGKLPAVYLRYSDTLGLGWYELGKDAIYLNTKYLMIFFDIKGYKASKIAKIMNSGGKTLKEFVYYTDTLYLHELTHCLQDSLYGKNRYMKEGGLYLEFEYEAFFVSDMYFHEKMKASPGLFKKIISGEYSDVYTNYDMDGYLMVSMDPAEYKKNIEKRYRREISGYISLSEEEELRKRRLEETKFLSYASGKEKRYDEEKKDYVLLERQRAEYEAFLGEFYGSNWPAFSADALDFISDAAVEAKNYPLALETASFAEKNFEALKGADTGGKLEKLKTKSALVILGAISYIKDHAEKMPSEILAHHFKALEKACLKTERPFPTELSEKRKLAYSETLKEYLKLEASEKDVWKKEYYAANSSFFMESLVKNYNLKAEEFRKP